MVEFDFNLSLGESSFSFRAQCPAPVTALLGRSGSGKSTLAKTLCGLIRPKEGIIRIGGEEFFNSNKGIHLPAEHRGIGFVFQNHRLFPHLSVRNNLLFGSKFGARRSKFDLKEVSNFLNIEDLLTRDPSSLSGGESQRVSLGRALLASENLLIMDEPLSSLDPALKNSLLEVIASIPDRFNVPVFYITHSREEAARIAKSALLIDSGRVVASGSVESVISNPVYRGEKYEIC